MLPSTADDILLDELSPGNLIRYSKTCKANQDRVNSYIRRHFRLENVLQKYFTETEISKFRKLQHDTGMFISGSTALQFFERRQYPDSDLDLYVEHRFRRVVSDWLLSVGYTYLEVGRYPWMRKTESLEEILERDQDPMMDFCDFWPSTDPGGYLGVVIILNFEKHNPYRKIQVITSHHAPLQMVLNFHSTCVMNIITHEKAYSIFPKGTFEERRSLICLPIDSEKRKDAIKKYQGRGWNMVNQMSIDDSINPKSSFTRGTRYLGDSKCWVIPILPTLDHPHNSGEIEGNTWALYHDVNFKPQMVFSVIFWDRLRFSYIYIDEAMEKQLLDFVDKTEETQEYNKQVKIDWKYKEVVQRYLSERSERLID